MIEQFFTWPLVVERKTGTSNRGKPELAEPVTIMSRIRMTTEQVTNIDGDVVTTVATCSMDSSTELIPIGSRATLPPELGGRRAEVVVAGLHDTRIDGIPSFYQIRLGGGA